MYALFAIRSTCYVLGRLNSNSRMYFALKLHEVSPCPCLEGLVLVLILVLALGVQFLLTSLVPTSADLTRPIHCYINPTWDWGLGHLQSTLATRLPRLICIACIIKGFCLSRDMYWAHGKLFKHASNLNICTNNFATGSRTSENLNSTLISFES